MLFAIALQASSFNVNSHDTAKCLQTTISASCFLPPSSPAFISTKFTSGITGTLLIMTYTLAVSASDSTPNSQAPTAAVQRTTPSKAIGLTPAFGLISRSRNSAPHLGNAIGTKLNHDEIQGWLAGNLECHNPCNFDRVLKYMLSLWILPTCHLEEVTKCIKAYCTEATNAEETRYAPNGPSLVGVAAYYQMQNNYDLATVVGPLWYDDIERTGRLPFIDLCRTDFWAGLIGMRGYRHELEGEIWVLPWTHLQIDDDNNFQSHPRLVLWRESLEVAQLAKNGMYTYWGKHTPLAPWKSEWPLAYALCRMLHREAQARTEIKNGNEQNPDLYPKLEDVEKSTEEVYVDFWVAVKRFYVDTGDHRGYRELRKELCLLVDG
ncbi:hypothetical protein OF83DRAFT_1286417 [Amylostereum chailletii]|nr:hypothetical protein OF83DRAFT_1286417 [Amylostereum chailletii]